jgi:hypothetical protein
MQHHIDISGCKNWKNMKGGGCRLIERYSYHYPNAAISLLHKVLIVSMFIRIAIHFLRSCKIVMSIIVSIFNNKENNPFINIFFGGGGNSQSPFIMNVFAIANALASTSTLLKYVSFFYWNVIASSWKQGLVCIGLKIENGVALLF